MRRYTRVLSLAGALLTVVVSCEHSPTDPDIATTVFAPALNVNVASMTKTSDGLFYQDSVLGTGAPAAFGNGVLVAYHGWLIDGTTFDSSTSGIAFSLGAQQVIAGWDEGITGMKVGGWRKLVIPPSLGYGKSGRGTIPGNAILVFNVQLKAVQ